MRLEQHEGTFGHAAPKRPRPRAAADVLPRNQRRAPVEPLPKRVTRVRQREQRVFIGTDMCRGRPFPTGLGVRKASIERLALSGTSRVTTEPALMTAPVPIVTPDSKVLPAPSHKSSPNVTSRRCSSCSC